MSGSGFTLKTESEGGIRDSPIIEVDNSDSSTIDDMVVKCDNLLKKNYSTYNKCTKNQENFKLRFTQENEDYKSLRSWLEKATENYLSLNTNRSDTIQIYEMLLKNKFVDDFVEHGLVRERLNLKFLAIFMECKNLGRSLNVIHGDVLSRKSEYEEIQYCEILSQFAPTEENIEYAKQGKGLRLKYANAMHECEQLNARLIETYEKFTKLQAEHQELTRFYRVLLQDANINKFVNYSNDEKFVLESIEKPEKYECSKCLDQTNDEKITSFNLQLSECQDKLMSAQQRCEQLEKKYSSMDEHSDKLCNLLHKYQQRLLHERKEKFITSNNSIKNFAVGSRSNPSCSKTMEEFSSCLVSDINIPEFKKESNEEMNLDEDEYTLQISSSDEEDHVSEKSVVLPDNDLTPVKDNSDSLTRKEDQSQIEKRYSMVKRTRSSSSSRYEFGQAPHSSSMSNSVVANSSVTSFPCNICNRNFSRKQILLKHKRAAHEGLQNKCTVCGKMFSSKYALELHTATHSSLKPYKCPFCDYSYPHIALRRIHVNRVHKRKANSYNEQPQKKKPESKRIENSSESRVTDFPCHICGRYYAQYQTLYVHKRMVHERYQPFKCKSCSKTFTRKFDLSKHELTHTSLRPHKCSICHQSYRDRKTLKKHLQNFHKDA